MSIPSHERACRATGYLHIVELAPDRAAADADAVAYRAMAADPDINPEGRMKRLAAAAFWASVADAIERRTRKA